jgi:NitT/TauT family transport system substrate-binding protein
MAAGQPKPAFYAVLFLVVAGLVGFAIYRSDIFAPKGADANRGDQTIDPKELGPTGTGGAEASDGGAITTVKEYKFRPSEKLPEVTSVSRYTPLADNDNTVRFALNIWAGWGPIIFANNGFKPGKVWKAPTGEEFKVELVLIDNPVAMRDAYANGKLHIGWGTLDMVPLFLESFVDRSGKPKSGFDGVMPRVYQQVDWSNGGDGIVVRDEIKSVADLRGKRIAFAQNSPSHYFLLNMLVSGGVQPAEIEPVPTEDAFQAAAAFNNERSLAACVSWAPDIYNLADVKGNRMLVNTQTANRLIADVWFARADFAKDNPGIVESLVRGIFDAMQDLKKQDNQQKCAVLMGEGYGGIPPSEVMKMFGDAHSTNWGENYQFFMNQNNPANFETVWKRAYYLYRRIGAISHQPVAFDQVMDFRIIEKLGKEEKYKNQREEYRAALPVKSIREVEANPEILSNTIVIHFYPNSAELFKKIMREEDGKTTEALYDPNVELVLELVLKEAGALAKQFGAARIIVRGHTDASMRGQLRGDDKLVRELSQQRADAVKNALIDQFDLEPERMYADGVGWSEPADLTDPDNHAKNRRVEIKVYAAEAQ